MDNEKFDGQIYLDEKDLIEEKVAVLDEEITWETGEDHPIAFHLDTKNRGEVIYKRKLAQWIDPTTPPKVRNKCVKMCSGMGIRVCCGWKLQKRWYYRKATLTVSTKSPAEIRRSVESCIGVAAIGAAIAAIVSGGSAAATAAERLLTTCLAEKLGNDLASVQISLGGGWGDWD